MPKSTLPPQETLHEDLEGISVKKEMMKQAAFAAPGILINIKELKDHYIPGSDEPGIAAAVMEEVTSVIGETLVDLAFPILKIGMIGWKIRAAIKAAQEKIKAKVYDVFVDISNHVTGNIHDETDRNNPITTQRLRIISGKIESARIDKNASASEQRAALVEIIRLLQETEPKPELQVALQTGLAMEKQAAATEKILAKMDGQAAVMEKLTGLSPSDQKLAPVEIENAMAAMKECEKVAAAASPEVQARNSLSTLAAAVTVPAAVTIAETTHGVREKLAGPISQQSAVAENANGKPVVDDKKKTEPDRENPIVDNQRMWDAILSSQSLWEINFEHGIKLEKMTAITPAVAQSLLTRFGTDMLFLNGLQSLTPETARILAKFKGWLNLDGLESASADVLRELAKYRVDPPAGPYSLRGLWLNGLKTLSEQEAAAISQHEGYLSLVGLETLSDPALNHLFRHRGRMNLASLQYLGDIDIDEYCRKYLQTDSYVSFGYLKAITDRQLTSLVRHAGREESYLTLGLTEMPDSQTQILSSFKGSLQLLPLQTVSEADIINLATSAKELTLGVSEITDRSAGALAKVPQFLRLYNLTTLSDRQAELLSHRKWSTDFGNLKNISEKGINFLASASASVSGRGPVFDRIQELRKQSEKSVPKEEPATEVECLRLLQYLKSETYIPTNNSTYHQSLSKAVMILEQLPKTSVARIEMETYLRLRLPQFIKECKESQWLSIAGARVCESSIEKIRLIDQLEKAGVSSPQFLGAKIDAGQTGSNALIKFAQSSERDDFNRNKEEIIKILGILEATGWAGMTRQELVPIFKRNGCTLEIPENLPINGAKAFTIYHGQTYIGVLARIQQRRLDTGQYSGYVIPSDPDVRFSNQESEMYGIGVGYENPIVYDEAKKIFYGPANSD